MSGGRGLGDRWLAGEPLPHVDFALHDRVRVQEGRHAGQAGSVLLLLDVATDPLYLVALGGAPRGVKLRQSALRPAS